jgi:DNA-binding NtrC family response regulator
MTTFLRNKGDTCTKVLIVDDNRELAAIIQEMLEAEGLEIKSAGNVREGYIAYLSFRPDLVIADVQMPEKNGLELIKIIRFHNPKIRTIYMSADLNRYQTLLEEEKKKYGASFIEKPFSKVELMRLVSP